MTAPPILPSGRLRDTRLPVLLQLLRSELKTGVLTLKRNDLNKSIFIQEGDIIFASSLYSDDRLGEVLLKTGKINFRQYEISVDLLKKTGKRQGTILVEQGFIAPKDLFEGVVFQVREIVLSPFTWVEGDYEFIEGPLPSEEVITLQISTGDIILDGIKRIQDWNRLIRDLPPLNSVLHLSTDPRSLFQSVNLNAAERDLLRLINGERTLRDVLSESTMSSMDCARVLYFFITAGILQPALQGTEEAEKVDRQDHHQDHQKETEEVPPAVEEEVLKQAFFDEEKEATVQKIREAYLQMENQNYYEILKVTPSAGRDEIKKAYFRLAKEYHPDRHFEAEMGQVKKELESLFVRITQAYDTLLVEKKRKAYDSELSSGKQNQKQAEPTHRDFFSRGQAALEKGDLRDACYFFQEAINKMPDRIDKAVYYLRYGQAMARIPGKLRDAAEILKKGVALDPTRTEFHVELGLIYSKTGLTQKAMTSFAEALKRDPNNKIAKAEIEKLHP
ncbi:MAG: DnaJ domain-containing protein [Candidatus Manganitrophus sp.]|nr:MAG: DnaJ domain-containing protein [Candidatus Manganitrophus sp.]